MSAVIEVKPRLSYAEFIAQQPKPLTIAVLIQRVMDDVAASPTTIRQFGTSTVFTLKRLQREPIGQVIAREFGKTHVIDHCRKRRETVCPATTKGDITALRGVFGHAVSAFPDCEFLTLKAFDEAKTFLVKNNLIGKANRRTRLPTVVEIDALLTDLAISDAHPNSKIKMVPVVAFGLVSARRRGEVCRITHGDVDYEKKIYWVRDLKHPTKKKGNDKSFTLWPELEQIIKMQPRLDPNDPTERIFPYNGESVGKRYIDAKKRCGIAGLRLHDNRGEATSKWIQKIGRDKTRKVVTGHDSEKAFDIYDRRTTVDIMESDDLIQKFLRPTAQPQAEAFR